MLSRSSKDDNEAQFLITKSSTVSDVFNGPDTMIAIFNFLVEAEPKSRHQLGVLSEVCRKWAEVAHGDMYWKGIMRTLLPWSVPEDDDKPISSSRRLVVEQGRCVTERGFRCLNAGIGQKDLTRWGRLSLSIEIFDKVSGTRLYWTTQKNLEPITQCFQDGCLPSVNILISEGRGGEHRNISIPKNGFQTLADAFEARYISCVPPSTLPTLCERIFVVSIYGHMYSRLGTNWHILNYPFSNP